MARLQSTSRAYGLGSFAHLLGLSAAKADDKPEDKPAGAEDKPEDKPGGSAPAAEGDGEDCPECDGTGVDNDGDPCDECDGTGKAKKAKKAKKAEGDDDTCAEEDDQDEETAKAARAGRRFERTRCRKIFLSPAAAIRPDMAAHLAFETAMGATAAVALLETAAQGGRVRPGADRAPRPRVELGAGGGDGKPTAASAAAARILAAGQKRRGEA